MKDKIISYPSTATDAALMERSLEARGYTVAYQCHEMRHKGVTYVYDERAAENGAEVHRLELPKGDYFLYTEKA